MGPFDTSVTAYHVDYCMTHGDKGPPTYGARQSFMKIAGSEPITPTALNDGSLKQRAHEEEDEQGQGFQNVHELERPPSENLQSAPGRELALVGGDVDGDCGAYETRESDGANAGANDRGSIT